MFDAGTVTICTLRNTAAAGQMPKEQLQTVTAAYFGERTVGYNRYYAAAGVNEQIDLLIRIWRTNQVRIGMYAVLSMSENDGQYRITNVQQLLDDDGLKVTDLTLQRLERNYDVTAEA
jgi:hypothetical protein